jgi:diguanylate cyclase (GGDEF)-like protein
MNHASEISALAALGLPTRLAAASLSLWCAAILGLAFAQRPRSGDAMVRRSRLVTMSGIVGACAWAGHLCLAIALGVPRLALGGGALALVLATAGAAAALLTAMVTQPAPRWSAAAGSVALVVAETLVWALQFESPVPAWLMGLAAALAQALTLGCLVHWRQRQATAPWSRTATMAGVLAIAQAVPLAMALQAHPLPSTAPGGELLFAVLATGMALLSLQASRLERHLMGKHQMLGAQLQQATAHLQRTPLSDPLTGLMSRLGLEAALRQAAQRAETQGHRVALLAVGLDGFKSVNDSFGHALGDSVLREVARRLLESGEQLIAPPKVVEPTLARLGGDEFVLMLHGQLDRHVTGRAASHLLEVLDGPLACDGHELRLSASIGIACFPEDGGATKLIGRANAAMQAAKAAGGSTYMSFEPRMQDDARDRHELLRDLRHAVEKKQLELFYQPKIDARSGQVTAAEALLRWHHPVRGTISPGVFVPLAERHGLIGALGNWVIEDACRQARVWRELGLKMRVAINLSVFQMRQNDLVERVQAALKRHGVNPSRLTCEITESVAMEDTQVTQRTFERLGQAGIHLSIDDFGTGYSSLSYLRRLPATELKIDRSFVLDLEMSADARAIVDAVLKLAHAIGLKVVAEGVETVAQRDILLDLGCDEFQGYLFARPMSARALTMWAVDDRAGKNAFRPSLFADLDGGHAPSVEASLQFLTESPPSKEVARKRRASPSA